MTSAAYRIKDVADRSGFSAAAVRYYEQIGLLPEAARTQAGYRLYDDRTIERLAFIARAKQLGCSLDEIADLASAWDGGMCGPVQDRLRVVVRDKLATAQRRIVELTTLTSELRRAAIALEGHRPDGACDDTCGCVRDPGDRDVSAAPQAVSLMPKPHTTSSESSPPIACTLGSESLQGRLEDWQALLAHVDLRTRIAGGVRATLDGSTPLDELMRLVAAEQDCCQFFDFSITIDARGIALEVRAPAAALSLVDALFGAPA